MDLFSQSENPSDRDFVQVFEHNEYHGNGTLAYTEKRAYLKDIAFHKYEARIVEDKTEGFEFIRIGRCAKYFDNGQLAWELNYDNMGNVVKGNKPNYRKDGTPIIYS